MFEALKWDGTPGTAGTGWFDRHGVERPLHGHLGEGRDAGKPYSNVTLRCSRCGGAGRSDKWIKTGFTCYDCGGSGKGNSRPERLYRADDLTILNARRDALRAKKAAKAAEIAGERKAAQEASTEARKAALAVDPFYLEFQALMATFGPDQEEYEDEYGNACVRRGKNPTPDFLADMWKQVQHKDLSDKQVAAVEKFIASRKEQERKKAASAFIADVGKRVEIFGKVVYVRELENNGPYPGRKFLIKIETRDEQALTWFTSYAYNEGETLRGKATIKAHKEFNGRRETQITNFRIKDAPDGKQAELV